MPIGLGVFLIVMISYRLANSGDNEQLLELTRSSAMSGLISLRIDRNPDFFELLKYRGESKVFVATENNTIVGCICVSKEEVYVREKKQILYYVCDLKVSLSHRNRGIGMQLTNEITEYLAIKNADLVFSNVSKGNMKPYSLFKNCPGRPDLINIGHFKVFQFIGAKSIKPNIKYKIETTCLNDDLVFFFNDFYSKYQLGEVITKEKLEKTQILTVYDNDKMVAAMCVVDTMNAKQNVVVKLPWYLRYVLGFINNLGGILSISKMPREKEPIKMLYIKYLAVPTYNKEIIRLLLEQAKNCAYDKSYSFVSIGLHEKDPIIKSFHGLFKITFYSVGMLVSLKNNEKLIDEILKGVPFKDYSIV